MTRELENPRTREPAAHYAGLQVKRLGPRYYVELRLDGRVFMTSPMYPTRAEAVRERDAMQAAMIAAAKEARS